MAGRRTHRAQAEDAIIKKREKQFQHDQVWETQKKYYENWEKKNTKFDEWTSPRYHQQHGDYLDKLKKKRDKEDNLEKRREKLRKLFYEEERAYEIEMMMMKTKKCNVRTPRSDEVSIDVLKELNRGLKLDEEDRRRHEAELKLYHQWRCDNPALKHYERLHKSRELKLSWLDQQVENRMKKEKEEEECRKLLAEREVQIKKQEKVYEEEMKTKDEKKLELKKMLDEQVEELKKKTELSDELWKKENEENDSRNSLIELQQKMNEDERKKNDMECALFNIKHHKLRLKKKSEEIERRLDEEKNLIMKLRDLQVTEKIEDQLKRQQIKQSISMFLEFNKEQKALEKKRLKHFEFIFDSEAKYQYDQQCEAWRQDEEARRVLLKDVLDTVKEQIDGNLRKNKEKQLEMLKEREELVRKIEEYNEEIELMKRDEEERTREWKRMVDQELKMKSVRKKVRENVELRKIDEELERVRKEEERLKEEIIRMQRREGPYRPRRSNILF